MKVKFYHVVAVMIAEWIKRNDIAKWKREMAEMNETARNRYDFIVANYSGNLRRKINKNNA